MANGVWNVAIVSSHYAIRYTPYATSTAQAALRGFGEENQMLDFRAGRDLSLDDLKRVSFGKSGVK